MAAPPPKKKKKPSAPAVGLSFDLADEGDEFKVKKKKKSKQSAPLLPVVDAARCTCNDPHEVALCLGIEAAMATIGHEVDAVISADSSKVERRRPGEASGDAPSLLAAATVPAAASGSMPFDAS